MASSGGQFQPLANYILNWWSGTEANASVAKLGSDKGGFVMACTKRRPEVAQPEKGRWPALAATSSSKPLARTQHLFNFPRLAGQQKDYLVAQLTAFRDHKRADPHAQRLSNPTIVALATYYSAQPPTPGTPDNFAEAPAGRKIYTEGFPAHGVPACMTCHGARGVGNAALPRLAGQHTAYIERQLEAFASNARANIIMHENSKNLTPEQIGEVRPMFGAFDAES
jgi:cytochrome c553